MTPPSRVWPRWPTLVALTLAVLGAHLVLLTDGLPRWSAPQAPASTPAMPKATAAITRTLAAAAPPPRAAAAQTSQVRWIAPAAAPPATPAQAAKPAAAAPPEPKRVAAPAATPEAAAAVAPEPDPAPMPEPAATALAPAEADAPLAAEPATVPEPNLGPPPAGNGERQLGEAMEPNIAADTHTGAAPDATATRPAPAQPPASAQLSYSVEGRSKGLTYNASGFLDWRNDGGSYSARMEIRMFLLGSRVQLSEGHLTATGLQPVRFADKRLSERATHFDRSQQRIRFSNNAPDAALLPGAQDRLSVFLQLAGLLNAQPEAYPNGHLVALPVAGSSDSEVWRFRVQELTSLELPAGSLMARHLVREPREPRDTRVDIWLAPSLGHLPVRIRLTQDNGDVVDQRLSSLP